MKRILLPLSVIFVLLMTGASFAQKKKTAPVSKSEYRYYLDLTRPRCCELTDRNWQQIAASLQKAGIPAFFGIYETIDFRENWKPVKLRRTASKEGWLMLGPFATASAAEKALARLPRLLPKHGDVFRGVESGPTTDKQTWQIGMYQIEGSKTNQPVEVQTPRVPKSGVLEGRVVETTEGMNWYGIIIESGGIRYLIQLGGNSGAVEKIVGEVEKIGNRVRVTYRDKRAENDGSYFLDATSVEEIK